MQSCAEADGWLAYRSATVDQFQQMPVHHAVHAVMIAVAHDDPVMKPPMAFAPMVVFTLPDGDPALRLQPRKMELDQASFEFFGRENAPRLWIAALIDVGEGSNFDKEPPQLDEDGIDRIAAKPRLGCCFCHRIITGKMPEHLQKPNFADLGAVIEGAACALGGNFRVGLTTTESPVNFACYADYTWHIRLHLLV